jgi:RHS repeat-associated protein
MRVHHLTCAFTADNFRQSLARFQPRRLTARIVCILLTISLLCSSAPAAPQTIVSVTTEMELRFSFWLYNSGSLSFLKQLLSGHYLTSSTRPETQTERNARVKRLQISPGDVIARIGEVVRFSAIAYGEGDDTIGGVEFRWRVTGEEDAALIGPAGDFSSLVPGKFKVSVSGAGQKAETLVTVLDGPPPIKERNSTVRQFSTRALPPNPQTTAQQTRSSRSDRRSVFQKASFNSGSSSTSAPAPLPQGSDTYGWNLGNYTTADDPGSQVGDPPGIPEDGGAGNGNFQLAVPVVSLQGRGINISLTLSYNAHLWHKAGNNITYDIDRGWPAPGWSFGFGKMADIGDGGAIIEEADGTRHGFNGTATGPLSNSSFSGRTNDGTFIDYACVRSNGVIIFGSATLPNGTRLQYGAAGDGSVYPTSIVDPNGNYITITYRNNAGPQIDTVTDTLGRVINFYYDSNNLLTAVTVPPFSGSTARTAVRLHYQQQSISPGFTGGVTTLVRAPTTRWLVDAIYFPATNTGYWFNDADSFLTNYGTIKKVEEQRNMAHSSAGLTDMGTVTPGTMTKRQVYTWVTTASSPPTYSTLTESWAFMDSSAAVTSYVVDSISTPRTTTVTLPNGTKSVQYSHNAPGQFNDGLVFKDETYDTDGTTLLSRSEVTWQQGDYSSPRPQYTTATTRQGANLVTTGNEFTYATSPSFNQVTEVRNYDFGYVWQASNVLLRKTVTQFENSTNYTNRHIFNLPKIVSVYSGGGTKVSQTEYTYDGGGTVENTPNVVQHLDESNPYAPVYTVPGHYITQCSGCPPCSCTPVWIPPTTSSPYNPQMAYRGNVTQVKIFADAVTLDQTTASVETRAYDMTGNMVEASPACCQLTQIDFSATYQYAYPEKQTRGSSSDPLLQVATSSTYNFNTGLVTSTTDANGRMTQTGYFESALRPQTVTLPTTAHTDYAYDDVAMTVTESIYLGSHPTDSGLSSQTVKSLNGRGQTRVQAALGAGGVFDYVDTIYDVVGRISQQSAPYRTGDTKQWTTKAYDSLGRTTRVTAPDGSVTESYYNEVDFDTTDGYAPTRPNVATQTVPGETVLVRDAWGRERWGRENAEGKLVEVVEPNPSGSGSVATSGLVTTYSYNTLGNLTGVTQDQQTRSFKYDSMGRVTAQKLAEAQAMLNDAGVYVSSGGTWSEVFTYDPRSNLTSRTDARGVKTVYDYNIVLNDPNTKDPLNRVRRVSWDTSGFGDTNNPIAEAKSLTYAYRTKSQGTDLRDITQTASITTTDTATETYTFDSESRVSGTTLTLNSRTSYPFITTQVYDELGRVKDFYYPAQTGNGGAIKVLHQDYDVGSRLSGLTYDGQSFASNIVYNAASQTTSMRVGQAGANQIIETYDYTPSTGLLEHQTIARSSAPSAYLLDLSYDYAGSNSKRTGQLKKVLNNLNHNKDRNYSYDAVRRLIQATGGPAASPIWTQTYAYDRYGNRTSVTASGYSAKNERPVGPTRTDLLAKNIFEPPSILNDGTKAVSDSPMPFFPAETKTGASAPPPPPFQGGPPTFTDDPLTAGTLVKAIHVTELRNAINLLRQRAGLATVTWAESVSNAVLIKASHITEMRTRLGEARTALALAPTTYTDPNLATGYDIKKEHIQEIRDSLKAAWTVSSQISRDGYNSLSYDVSSNRITAIGFAYDVAGNQVRALIPGGTASQRYQYDAANRLANVKTDDGSTVIASYTYGHSNVRLMETAGTNRTYYVSSNNTTVAEFSDSGAGVIPNWSKSCVYLGIRLLSTHTPNGSNGEVVEYSHPDRLGTRLTTTSSGGSFENSTLPFGTLITSETTAATTKRFTTYDRNGNTKLDYAVNRHYDSLQGRFTQVDPAGMKAVSLDTPQTLNLYAYCANDPINQTDPSGLGFISFLKKLFHFVLMVAAVAALMVISFVAPFVLPAIIGPIVSWVAYIGAVMIATQIALEFIGHINQWLHRCRVPDFAGLTQRRQDELRRRGVSPEQWDGLTNKARLAYFNIVAAITSLGLSLEGWLVDWTGTERGRGINQDRVFFIAGPGATNLFDTVKAAGSGFTEDINKGKDHGIYRSSYRQDVFYKSLQLSFTPQGTRLDADLDFFNPNLNSSHLIGTALHGLSVFSNMVSSFFKGSGLTNPYNVAYRSSWECK